MGGPKWRIENCHVIMRKVRMETIVGGPKWRIEDCHVIMRKARSGPKVGAVTFNAESLTKEDSG